MTGDRLCGFCRAPFEAKSLRQVYCSDGCRYTARDRLRGHLEPGTEMTTECSQCHQPFKWVLHRRHRRWCDACLDAKVHRPRPEW
jgi:hypothetical protein